MRSVAYGRRWAERFRITNTSPIPSSMRETGLGSGVTTVRVPTGVVQAGSPGLQNQISEAEVFSTAASMREPPVYPVGHAVLSGKSLRKTLTVPMLLLDISPMTPIDGKYDGMVTFVNGPTAGVAPIRLISAAEMDPVELSSVSVPLNMQGDGEHEAPVVPGIRLADTSNVTMSARAVPAPTN